MNTLIKIKCNLPSHGGDNTSNVYNVCIESLHVFCKLVIGEFPTRALRRDGNLRQRLCCVYVTWTQTAG